ncbi:hypothetical protein [Ectobacillus antri]|uniref:hypothetical protein n=1 Tax=Ectobacillus antri TaxID=2486280 RepID=UPI000F5ABE4B|nr:hypothetical protein [Ectobacillus antri]
MAYTKWNLERIFEEDKEWSQIILEIDSLKKDVDELKTQLDVSVQDSHWQYQNLEDILKKFDKLLRKLGKVDSFLKCKKLDNSNQEIPNKILNELNDALSLYQRVNNNFNSILATLDYDFLVESNQALLFKQVSFQLKERKGFYKNSSNKVSEDELQEAKVNEQEYYSKISSIVNSSIEFQDRELLVKELLANINSNDTRVRRESFQNLNAVLIRGSEDLFIIFKKIMKYKKRKYHSNSYENGNLIYSLEYINKISIKSFNQFEIEHRNIKKPVLDFLKWKADRLEIKDLSWVDLYVNSGDIKLRFTFDNAKEIILSSFKEIDKNLYMVAKKVFAENWINVTKHNYTNSGFCLNIAAIGESRISVNFTGSFRDVLAIAHEIGHAFHNYVIRNLHIFNHNYSLCIAEAIAIFCENVVFNEMISRTNKHEEKVFLMETRLQDATFYLLEMYSCSLFEKRIFEHDNKSMINNHRDLSRLMVKSQQEVFNNCLLEYSPTLWITQRHFYNTNFSFYNISYSIGYLVSLFLLSIFKDRNGHFSHILMGVLSESGSMMLEDLFVKYTGIEFMSSTFTKSVETQLQNFLKIKDFNI